MKIRQNTVADRIVSRCEKTDDWRTILRSFFELDEDKEAEAKEE